MGLIVSIYKAGGQSSAGPGGLSCGADKACLVGRFEATGEFVAAGGPFLPSAEMPAVALSPGLGGFGGWRAVPVVCDDVGNFVVESREDSVGPMMGGCYIGTSDSRFAQLAGRRTTEPVALHDRFETVAQYATYD